MAEQSVDELGNGHVLPLGTFSLLCGVFLCVLVFAPGAKPVVSLQEAKGEGR